MTDKPVNLNRFRKAKARADKKARADRNAVLHGLPKAARDQVRQDAERSARTLDGKRKDTD